MASISLSEISAPPYPSGHYPEGTVWHRYVPEAGLLALHMHQHFQLLSTFTAVGFNAVEDGPYVFSRSCNN